MAVAMKTSIKYVSCSLSYYCNYFTKIYLWLNNLLTNNQVNIGKILLFQNILRTVPPDYKLFQLRIWELSYKWCIKTWETPTEILNYSLFSFFFCFVFIRSPVYALQPADPLCLLPEGTQLQSTNPKLFKTSRSLRGCKS